MPTRVDQWQWTVPFYPPSHHGVRAGNTARTFAEPRAAFERIWREIEPHVTEADRLEQRRERARTELKYKMWSASGPHIRFARNHGWAEDELVEAILHLLGYV